MNLGKILHEHNIDGVKDINFKGRNKLGIHFENPRFANEFITNNKLREHNLKTYIPQSMLYCRGLVKGIGDQITEEDFIRNGFGVRGSKKIRIVDATRFNYKKEVNGQTVITPGSTYMLLFAGNAMPQEVKLYHTKKVVFPYIPPVILCHNCLRYGHHQSQCRNQEKCIHCGEEHNRLTCRQQSQQIKICPKCKGSHEVTSKDCKEYIRQKKINKAIVDHNISYYEANKLFTVDQEEIPMSEFPNTLQQDLNINQQKNKNKIQASYANQTAKKIKIPPKISTYDKQKHKEALLPNSSRIPISPMPSQAGQPPNNHQEVQENTGDPGVSTHFSPLESIFSQKSIIENIIGTQNTESPDTLSQWHTHMSSQDKDMNID